MYKEQYLQNVGSGSCIQKGRHMHEMRWKELLALSFSLSWASSSLPKAVGGTDTGGNAFSVLPMPFSNEQFSAGDSSLFCTPQKAVKSPVVKGGSSLPSHIIIRFA